MGHFVNIQKLSHLKFIKPVVLTGGSFDLIHLGHAEFLRLCKKYGKTLIVQIASDKYVRKNKGKFRPIVGEKDRAKLISYLEFVDYSFISGSRCEDQKILEIIKPDFLVLSDENKEEKINYIKSHNSGKTLKDLRVKFIPSKFYSVDISTSNLVNTIIKKHNGKQ